VSKMIGCYIGGIVGGIKPWEALSVGTIASARGAMDLILAAIGLSLGILTVNMFSIVVLMALVTTFLAPSMLKLTLKHVRPEMFSEPPAATDGETAAAIVAAPANNDGAPDAKKVMQAGLLADQAITLLHEIKGHLSDHVEASGQTHDAGEPESSA
jgi:hypothetical protein